MRTVRTITVGVTAGALLLLPAIASAHPHSAPNGQIIANGHNHPAFTPTGDGSLESCDGNASAGPAAVGPSWYGIETAHHGPDQGDPGRGDGCYELDPGTTPATDDGPSALG
ncbi:MAG: hypothetical protein KY457_09195 [Actinobacteria bacterium]|nr:hypothetical protein [Actinomycetota bacterium]